jgi:hypothetical protein
MSELILELKRTRKYRSVNKPLLLRVYKAIDRISIYGAYDSGLYHGIDMSKREARKLASALLRGCKDEQK